MHARRDNASPPAAFFSLGFILGNRYHVLEYFKLRKTVIVVKVLPSPPSSK